MPVKLFYKTTDWLQWILKKVESSRKLLNFHFTSFQLKIWAFNIVDYSIDDLLAFFGENATDFPLEQWTLYFDIFLQNNNNNRENMDNLTFREKAINVLIAVNCYLPPTIII